MVILSTGQAIFSVVCCHKRNVELMLISELKLYGHDVVDLSTCA
jgi:hypothetical protein